ncbi:helicase-related protein [Halococcus salifodinae]|uniref:helicase-related protein n=1 Tax=Halococcus salifodinae TaxID=36738 RepID=UPI000677BE76|nr:helicase-related protein [Halococcus salifodinae]
MDETIQWLRNRSQHQGRIQYHERVSGREATRADLDLNYRLEMALARRDIEHLYQHQVSAIEAIRDDQNAVLATPTASDKSLAYTIPAFERAIDHGGRTLYRTSAALINDQEETLATLADDITAYQAALKQSRREEIEEGLHDGSIRSVWSTNALELGVDVGGLDIVLLNGYPGMRMSTHQRAGRAG